MAQFHQAVLALPEVRELLKGFEVVRLDGRCTSGARTGR